MLQLYYGKFRSLWLEISFIWSPLVTYLLTQFSFNSPSDSHSEFPVRASNLFKFCLKMSCKLNYEFIRNVYVKVADVKSNLKSQ